MYVSIIAQTDAVHFVIAVLDLVRDKHGIVESGLLANDNLHRLRDLDTLSFVTHGGDNLTALG